MERKVFKREVNKEIFSNSKAEATGIYQICERGNIINNTNSRYVVLDTEITFAGATKQNGADMLLYDIKECELLFVKVKHWSDKEIQPKTLLNGTETLEILEQIGRYNSEIETRKEEILSAYEKYVQNINDTYNMNMPMPKSVNQKCGLVIWGQNSIQREQLKEAVYPYLDSKVKYYAIGNPKEIDISTLYESLK